MSALTSISPATGAPGTVITLTGSGFQAASQVACPVLVETTYVNATTLQAIIPASLEGPSGGSMALAVFVQDPGGALSNMLSYTIRFPAIALQAWTTIDAVCGEIPGFQRGGQISDVTITGWMVSVSQTISGMLLQRGLPLDPKLWQQPDPASVAPSPAAVLDQIARYGAAARLASAVSGQFASGGGQWSYATNLAAAYSLELKRLETGGYDKLFSPSAATIDSGPTLAGGDVITNSGRAEQAFRKDQVF